MRFFGTIASLLIHQKITDPTSGFQAMNRPPMGANALIIGTGGVGSVIGQKLHGYDAFDRIYLSDVDTTYAERLRQRTKKSRFEVVSLDALNTVSVAEMAADADAATAAPAPMVSRLMFVPPIGEN